MSKELVKKWFNKLPSAEQNIPLLIIDGIAYTPRQAYDEVNRGSPLGDKLQNLIESGRFGTTSLDEKTLIKQRLLLTLRNKESDKPLFVSLPSSGVQPQVFSKSQLMAEIESGSLIGQQWMNNEANFMRRLLQVR